MKNQLAHGKSCLGVSLMFYCPQVVEMLGYLGIDWILLDCEHGSLDLSDVEQMSTAANSAGISVIGRPPTNSSPDIMAMMDRGVDGVQVPHITTSEEARRAVDAVKFHPDGNRSLAIGTRSSKYGIGQTLSDYVSTSNSNSIVVLQIEDKEAIPNLDDILNTTHVDVFFVGPSDLSQSLGYPGKASEAPVKDVIDQILKRIDDAGKTSGTAGNIESIIERRSKGVSYLYTHLNTILEKGVANLVNS